MHDVMIGHGFYPRKALGPVKVHVLRIKRWHCKACHRTVSLLPSFLLRFRHYLLVVIQSVVVTRFEDEASWAQVSRRCAVEGAPSPRTIRRWCDLLAEHASAWWAAVQQTLAEHNATSPLLDPLGETAGPRNAPRALLQAAFLWREKRKVRKDATLSLQGNRYQVEPQWAGRTLELRFDPFDLSQVELYLDGTGLGLATVIVQQDGQATVTVLGKIVTLPCSPEMRVGDAAYAVIRPEAVQLTADPTGDSGHHVSSSVYLGSSVEYEVETGDHVLTVVDYVPRLDRLFCEGCPVSESFDTLRSCVLPREIADH